MTGKVDIATARPEHLADIAALAAMIWRAHYPGIIAPAQIEYMLSRMYDVEVMRGELESGTIYLRALVEGELRGFAACGPWAPDEAKLHKLYVHPQWQRRGIGAALLEGGEHVAQSLGARTLALNVNKRNQSAISAYQKQGFAIRESVVVDIGGGFVMDDYIMAKPIAA